MALLWKTTKFNTINDQHGIHKQSEQFGTRFLSNVKSRKAVGSWGDLGWVFVQTRGSVMQNRFGYKTFAEVVMFHFNVSGCHNDGIISSTSVIGKSVAAVRKFHLIKETMAWTVVCAKGVRAMMARFEETEKLVVQHGRGHTHR